MKVPTLCLTSALDWNILDKSRPRPLCLLEKDLITTVQEAWWTPRPVWKCAENFASTGIRCPELSAIASSYTDYARSGQTVDHELPADCGRFLVSAKICRRDKKTALLLQHFWIHLIQRGSLLQDDDT